MPETTPQPNASAATYPMAATFEQMLGAWRQDATEAYESEKNGTPRGAITGLKSLDKELGGAFSPGLHVLHGSAGAGKTAFCLQVAAACGTGALYVSCEMSALELFRRTAARITGTFLERFKTGELHPDASMRLAMETAEAVPRLMIADASGGAQAREEWIEEQVEALADRYGTPPLVVIDSVHSWTSSIPSGMQEYDSLNLSLQILRQMAQRHRIAVLCISERNRDAERSKSKTGGLNSSAGTRSFEYGAETVISLDRAVDAEGHPVKYDMNGEAPVGLRLVKNRHGAAGERIETYFSGRLQRFREVPK